MLRSSNLKATGFFVILLSQDGFESDCPKRSLKQPLPKVVQKQPYSRASNRRNSPLVKYSVFLPPSSTLFSTPHLLILEKFASLPFLFQTPRLLIHVHSRQR